MQLTTPPVGFWLHDNVPDDLVKHLWTCIGQQQENVKHELAGHISQSYSIPDTNSKFTKYLLAIAQEYYKANEGHPHQDTLIRKGREWVIKLDKFWVNYQKKHEFQPLHSHTGMYSFVVWMKIPYNCKEENEYEFMQDVKKDERNAGCFCFTYTDLLGRIKNAVYEIDQDMENTILFFPAGLKHQVYPFFTSNEERVSISGNLSIDFNKKHE
tara:strand:- start:53 stop:688 length:636 start_codon:yes stop_codon:yes gene_type:complete